MADPSPKQRFPLYVAGAIALCVVLILVLRAWSSPDPPKKPGQRGGSPTTEESPSRPDLVRPAASRPPLASSNVPERTRRQRGEALFEAPWGGGKGQLGLSRPAEGNPEAPMSFALDRSGQAWVLDQVNERMVRYGADGSVLSEQRLDQRVPQDVALTPEGNVLVLDRLGDKNIAVFGPDGVQKGTLPLEGKGIEETGAVTGVFVDGNEVYAEVEHGTLVSLGTTDGTPSDERTELPGRPSRDGRLLLSAGITSAQEGRIYVSAVRRNPIEHQFTREFRLVGIAMYILLLDSDRTGTIYVATLHDPAPQGPPAVTLTCLEPERGEPLGSVELPANTSADETFREMTVLDDGGVVYAVRTEAGVAYRYYTCP